MIQPLDVTTISTDMYASNALTVIDPSRDQWQLKGRHFESIRGLQKQIVLSKVS